MTQKELIDAGRMHALTPIQQPRRLNFLLAESSYQVFQNLASRCRKTTTDLIKHSLDLLRLVLEAKRSGHRIIVVDQDERPVKEITIPISLD